MLYCSQIKLFNGNVVDKTTIKIVLCIILIDWIILYVQKIARYVCELIN